MIFASKYLDHRVVIDFLPEVCSILLRTLLRSVNYKR